MPLSANSVVFPEMTILAKSGITFFEHEKKWCHSLCAFLLYSGTVCVHFYSFQALSVCISIISQHFSPCAFLLCSALSACISTTLQHSLHAFLLCLYVFVCVCLYAFVCVVLYVFVCVCMRLYVLYYASLLSAIQLANPASKLAIQHSWGSMKETSMAEWFCLWLRTWRRHAQCLCFYAVIAAFSIFLLLRGEKVTADCNSRKWIFPSASISQKSCM